MMKHSESSSHPALDASATFDELDALFDRSFDKLHPTAYVRPLLDAMGDTYRSWLKQAGITVTPTGIDYLRPVFATAFIAMVEAEMDRIGMEDADKWNDDTGQPTDPAVQRMCAFVGLLFALDDCDFCDRPEYPWERD